MTAANDPIFIRGFSRSGGTLVVTMLDAHPIISMSYELYPNLLVQIDGQPINPGDFIRSLRKKRIDLIEDRNIRTFAVRCGRSGIDASILSQLVESHAAREIDFSDQGKRLRFVERVCTLKAHRSGKTRWGAKCNNHYEDYRAVWPNALFIDVIRDGRDVLASQLKTGDFDKSPAEIGKGWAHTHQRFRELAGQAGSRALEVRYEKLVTDPETESRRICGFLGIEFDGEMLKFHRKNLTIYKSTHLSMNRISTPIDSSCVGRWKKDVNQMQIAEFLSTAGPAMREFGYLDDDHTSC